MRGLSLLRAAAAVAVAASAVAAAEDGPRTPTVNAGPYRVVVDRISANRTNNIQFRTDDPRKDEPGFRSSRLIQLQVGLFCSDKAAAAGLATFQIKSINAELGGRPIELTHYGGVLENPNDTALVRAYVYAPNFPLRPTEIRSVEGEVVSYDRAAPLELSLPLEGAKLPLTVEQDGVKAVLRELSVDQGAAQLVLTLEAPQSSVLVNTVNDGTYGVTLLNTESRPASANGGTLLQPKPNQAEYRLSFSSLRGAPGKLLLRLLHRAGSRHVYPFRLEHLPLPDSLPAPKG